MEQLVAELKKILPFKETTEVGDVVLIAAKEPQMLAYAMVSDIVRDDSRKDEWWQVTLQILGVPLQQVTWALRTPQFTGQETFTMGGEGRFIKAIRFDINTSPQPSLSLKHSAPKKGAKGGLRVVK